MKMKIEMEMLLPIALSGAEAHCSAHESPFGADNGVRFSGLPRTEAGLQPAETQPEGAFKRLMEGLNSL